MGIPKKSELVLIVRTQNPRMSFNGDKGEEMKKRKWGQKKGTCYYGY